MGPETSRRGRVAPRPPPMRSGTTTWSRRYMAPVRGAGLRVRAAVHHGHGVGLSRPERRLRGWRRPECRRGGPGGSPRPSQRPRPSPTSMRSASTRRAPWRGSVSGVRRSRRSTREDSPGRDGWRAAGRDRELEPLGKGGNGRVHQPAHGRLETDAVGPGSACARTRTVRRFLTLRAAPAMLGALIS